MDGLQFTGENCVTGEKSELSFASGVTHPESNPQRGSSALTCGKHATTLQKLRLSYTSLTPIHA